MTLIENPAEFLQQACQQQQHLAAFAAPADGRGGRHTARGSFAQRISASLAANQSPLHKRNSSSAHSYKSPGKCLVEIPIGRRRRRRADEIRSRGAARQSHYLRFGAARAN